MVLTFNNRDGSSEKPYLNWLAKNPDGFVLQTDRAFSPQYIHIHSARCGSISNPNSGKNPYPYTGRAFQKFCSMDVDELISLAISKGREEPLKKPRCCKRHLSGVDYQKAQIGILAEKMSLQEISDLAKQHECQYPGQKTVTVKVYGRNEYISAYAKSSAGQACSLCKEGFSQSPQRFLDCHHIEFLRNGGADVRENVIGVCPNCHRILHIDPDEKVVEKLKKLAAKRAKQYD